MRCHGNPRNEACVDRCAPTPPVRLMRPEPPTPPPPLQVAALTWFWYFWTFFWVCCDITSCPVAVQLSRVETVSMETPQILPPRLMLPSVRVQRLPQ